MQRLDFQLKNAHLGLAILGSGGKVVVTPAGKQVKAIVRTATGAQGSNPITPNAGHVSVYLDNKVWGQLAFSGQTANFTVGQVVTGAQSGATGIIKSQVDAGATGTLTLVGITGDFILGEALSDPLGGAAVASAALSNGISNVDLFILAPDGSFLVASNVSPVSLAELFMSSHRAQCLVFPFSIYDTSAATETASGFTEPSGALFLPNPTVNIITTDAAHSIEVGTDSAGGSNDPDGFIDVILTTTAGLVKATAVNGATTLGALFIVQDSANAGDKAPEGKVSQLETITYTLVAATVTAEGYVYLPYLLCSAPFQVNQA